MKAGPRRGVAATALGAILAIAAGWWALALFPAAATAPEWVSRTRLACFGAAPGGLPNAGGWVLLVGEPLGMLAVLLTVWGDAVRRDLRALAARPVGKLALVAIGASLTWGLVTAVSLVVRLSQNTDSFAVNTASGIDPVAVTVPSLMLTDQHGRAFDLRELAGRAVLVTFAFSHCETMCPTMVREVLRVRREARRPDIPVVIVTVDPWRDVPSRLLSVAAAWNLSPNDRVLSGGIRQVNDALDAWGIPRRRDATTGDVVHPLVVILIAPDGRTGQRMDAYWAGLAGMLAGL